MKDLRIIFSNKKGTRIVREYNLIMDFVDEFEAEAIADGHAISAEFFENPLNQGNFSTMKDLYDHCKCILS